MYLKAIEIFGFKSFGERIKLDFTPGITSIVGPNGSGKSNILDAILWVLGEQSYKNIRAKESSDVVFSGGKGRGAASYAEVSLFIENRDRFFQLDEDDIKITRKLSNTGDNEYYVNDKRARLKDISDIFLDTGIGKSAYSVIGQGKVERIISSSSKEIKGIIEEAAGVKKFQQKKLEASKNLGSVQEELEKIELIFNEVGENRTKVERQAVKAKEYLEIKNRRDELFKGISLFEKYEKSEKLEKLNLESEELEKALAEKENILTELTKNLESLTQVKTEIKEKLARGHEANEGLKSEIELQEREKIRLKERETSFERELAEREESLIKAVELKMKRSLETAEKAREKVSLEEKLEGTKSENERIEKEIGTLEEKKRSSEVELDFKKKKIMDLEVEKLRLVNEIESGERRVKGSSSKIGNLKEELKDSQRRFDENHNEIERYSKEKEIKSKELSDAEERVEFLERSISETSIGINRASERVRTSEYEERRCSAKLSSLLKIEESNEGFFKGVKEILNLKMKGVEGAFITLINIPENLEKAIEAAIPGNLQDIVVESAEVAKKAISILKERKLGRASFLALDTIKPGSRRDIPKGDGIVGRASDLIETEPKFKIALDFLLGNLVVVENMDIGLRILKGGNFSGNIVTLSGELLSSRGRITGGENSNSTVSQIFERRKEIKSLEVQVKILKTTIDESSKELLKFNELLEKYENEICNIDSLQDNLRKQVKIAQENYDTYFNQGIRLQKEMKIIDMELSEEENYAKEYEKRVTVSQGEKGNIEDVIENMKREMDLAMEVQRELSQVLNETKNKYSDIKIAYLNGKDRIDQLVREIEREKREVEENLSLEIQRIENRIGQLKDEEGQLSEKYRKIEENILAKKERFENENRELLDLRRTREEFEAKEKRDSQEKREIETFLLQGKNGVSALFEKRERLKEEIIRLDEGLMSFEEVTGTAIDVDGLTSSKEEEKELSYRLRSFQNVNLLALEEFKELDEKYQFLLSQREDLIKGEATLRGLINEIQDHIENKFFEAYKEINENFDKMCMETLDNSEGRLILSEDQNFENCGVEIFVKYKNKKRQSLSLLSGGEKSMVAVAFIMAIFMYKPSPFTFLDEIEAALDDKNTRKLIGKLKEFTEKSQFILITHNKETMRESDSLFGVTMNKEIGISKIVPVKV